MWTKRALAHLKTAAQLIGSRDLPSVVGENSLATVHHVRVNHNHNFHPP